MKNKTHIAFLHFIRTTLGKFGSFCLTEIFLIFVDIGQWKILRSKASAQKKHKIYSCSMGSSIFWPLIMHYTLRRRVSCLTILKSTFKLQKPFLNKRIYELRYFKRIIMIMAMISTSLAGDSEYFCSITTINNNILLILN